MRNSRVHSWGGLIDVETAKLAAHSTIRSVIDYLDGLIYLSEMLIKMILLIFLTWF